MFQDDFCQQVFEVLVEIFWKESQNRVGRGQVPEGHQPSEAVQSLEQLQDKEGGGTRVHRRGRDGALHTHHRQTHHQSHGELTQVWGLCSRR